MSGVYIPAVQATATVRALRLSTAEFLSIHEQLDTIEVPREIDGARLTAAQRVTVLIGAYKSACTRVITG